MSNSKAVLSSPAGNPPFELEEAEYQALETALLQTERGRAFLGQYLRRAGGAESSDTAHVPIENPIAAPDADRILQAVQNLHTAILSRQDGPNSDHFRMGILEMAKAITRTREEIAAIRADDSGSADQLTVASVEMDAIIQSTEKATNDILQAAEKIQEVSWRLREAGADEALCEEIDAQATDIYMACSFQDITGQRTTKVIRVLQYLEARINSMIDIWGFAEEGRESAASAPSASRPAPEPVDSRPDAHLLNGPQSENEALQQDNIDAMMGGIEDMQASAVDNMDFDPVDLDEPAPVPGFEAGPAPSEAQLDQAMEQAEGVSGGDEIIDEEQLKALFS